MGIRQYWETHNIGVDGHAVILWEIGIETSDLRKYLASESTKVDNVVTSEPHRSTWKTIRETGSPLMLVLSISLS